MILVAERFVQTPGLGLLAHDERPLRFVLLN
jgi:hypothetical protein